VLIDSSTREEAGGTGRVWDWRSFPASHPVRLFVAGGLGAENVGEAIRVLRPFAVDASSRLEEAPGRKDPARVRAFISAVRVADEASGKAPGKADPSGEQNR
jgi:phosphoribosylanthranilate isomerase